MASEATNQEIDVYYAKATVRQVRADILRKADKVVIKRNGEVHVLGIAPNTNQHCWYLAGMIENLQDELGYELWMRKERA